jgi:hypothetical protein
MSKNSGTHPARPDLDAITVFTSIDGRPANKRIRRKPGGGIAKGRALSDRFIARTVPCPDLASLKAVLDDVLQREDQMISLSVFANVPEGADEWEVWPCWRLAQELGCDPEDRAKLAGFHKLGGKWVAARIKESMVRGNYLLFDRDLADEMPDVLAAQPFEDWRRTVALVVPGFEDCGMVRLPSTTSRIVLDGERLDSFSCHAIVKVDDADDIERAWQVAYRRTLTTKLAAAEPWDDDVTLAFRKGVYERKKGTGALLRWSWWSIYDRSTWAVAREVFDGKPHPVDPGIVVMPARAHLIDGASLRLSAITDPSPEEEEAMAAAEEALTGCRVTCTRTHRLAQRPKGARRRFKGWKIIVEALTEDTDLDLGGGKWATIAELQAAGAGHTRCQAPFRESSSMAAFYNTFADGTPFVFDSGTNEWFVLRRAGRPLTIELCERWPLEHRLVDFVDQDGRFHFGDRDQMRALSQVKPDDTLLGMVKLAPDAPRLKDATTVDWNRLPKHIAGWMGPAWENLAQVLPGPRGASALAAQAPDFRASLLTVLRTLHCGSFRSGNGEHSLAEWASLEAACIHDLLKHPEWVQVGDFELYARHAAGGPDLAIRPELAGQIRVQISSISRLGIDDLRSQLAAGGYSVDDGPPHIRVLQDRNASLHKKPTRRQVRAVRLSRGFLAEIYGTEPEDDATDGTEAAVPRHPARNDPESGGVLPFSRVK